MSSALLQNVRRHTYFT